ncbi:MAG TPA: RHS repeat-associated core domain-containing protein [Kiritimatiellia bacterium]|nr:RHS repeat-associated core domain-containing protein [Kiritimatiellia bacterium]HRZ11390.1 RHS repeat-associated core domain-containing protein [Kiritimatiellia bacterium]HSA17059.1 RHS repeat-associated core domain-containing protein [Kiritimatiellia bacterium]
MFLDGTKHHFTKQTDGGTKLFRMEATIDPFSNRYSYAYSNGLLSQVTGPNTNQYLRFSYQPATNSVPAGSIEFYYIETNASEVLLAGSFNGWSAQPMTQTSGVWQRVETLARGWHYYKFIVRYAGDTNDYWRIDPDNPTWAYTGSASDLQTNSVAVVDVYLISSVLASDGRCVTYQYGNWMPSLEAVDIPLVRADYGDGTYAEYSYYQPADDLYRKALMKTARDPHYEGPGRAIWYVYQTNLAFTGEIYEERSMVNSQMLSRLLLDNNNADKRIVVDADGHQTVQDFGTNAYATNAVGYVTRGIHHAVGGDVGMLWKWIDAMGRTNVYERTVHFGRATSVWNNVRGTRVFRYTDDMYPFYLAERMDEAGRTTKYQRDDKHRVVRVDYPDGSFETNSYNDSGQMVCSLRRNGAADSYEYDERGRNTCLIDGLGNRTCYAYDDCDRLAAISNSLGYVTFFSYNWRGQVTNAVFPDGTQERLWYDEYGVLTGRTDRAGGMRILARDAFGFLNAETDPTGATTYYQHDLSGRLLKTITPLALIVSNTYDGIGRKTREIYADDGTFREWHYDPDGVRTQYDRLAGPPTTFKYDPHGRLQCVTDPLNRTVSYGYDAAGNCTHETNALGEAIVHTFDLAGRVTSTRDCNEHTVSNVYDETGRLVQQIDANSNANIYTYDALGRLLCLTRGGPGFTPALLQTNSYNALGWIITSTDANGLMRSNTYDVIGRPLRMYMPDGAYNENQYSNTFLVKTLDRAGRQTVLQRDILGRVTNQVDNAGQSVRFVYEALGNLSDLYDQNGARTRFQYNAEGRQTAKIYADDTQYTYGYDAEGRLAIKLDAKNKTTVYQYDYVGNLTNIVYAADPAVSFTFDALNRMTRMVDGVGTTLYAYSGSCGALVSEDGPFENDALSYEYDNGKRLLSVTSVLSAVFYSYDALDRISAVVGRVGPNAPLTNTYTYHANGRLPSDLLRGNGTRTRYEYDLLKRLTNLVHETDASEVLASYAYTLNNADERTRVAIGAGTPSSRTIDYAYDPIGQLIGADSDQPGHSFAYSYDPAGNPVQQDNNGFVLTNVFNDLNQNVTSLWSGAVAVLGTANLTNGQISVQGGPASTRADGLGGLIYAATNLPVSDGTNTYTALLSDPFGRVSTSAVSVIARNRGYGYDANGNMTNDGQLAYTWDDADRLIEVGRVGSNAPPLMTCRYDGLGRRRERILSAVAGGGDPGSTNRYAYNRWLVVAVLDGSDLVLETYTHGPDLSGTLGGAGGIGGILTDFRPLTSDLRHFHFDGNGNVIACTDTNQTIVASLEYGPFGTLLTRSGSFTPRYRFSSKEWDDPVGLYCYTYRFYSPALGRWLSRDPVGEHGGINVFTFTMNSPHSKLDPFGLCETCGTGPGTGYRCCGGLPYSIINEGCCDDKDRYGKEYECCENKKVYDRKPRKDCPTATGFCACNGGVWGQPSTWASAICSAIGGAYGGTPGSIIGGFVGIFIGEGYCNGKVCCVE